MTTTANLALEGGDPRDPQHLFTGSAEPVETQLLRAAHDSSVSFEEYLYYASITRAEEKAANERFLEARGPRTLKSTLKGRFSKGQIDAVPIETPSDSGSTGMVNEKSEKGREASPREVSPGEQKPDADMTRVTPDEWRNASRALRTAGWSSVFYLVTTDILGPFSVPWAFAQMGYGPGVALYTVFGGLALYSGFQLYKVFLHLDSDRYPMKTYADAFFRVFGSWARHFVNVLQAIQLLLTVSVLILGNGQSISQISLGPSQNSANSLCFIVCLIIFMAAGMVVGQIRTLQRFGWLANFAIWLNVLILIFSMAVAANFAPNFPTLVASYGPNFGPGPIHRYAGTPPDGMATGGTGFTASLNGLNQAVYSYGGAMLFISFMAEMRHPWDFWKGLLCADIFIYVCYMFFGLFVYSYQGQFAYNPVMQGLSPYGWRTACNVMNIITGLISACLYSNIGIKVAYVEVFQEFLHFPPLTTKRGKILWMVLVPIYWVVAWVVCSAIPQFSLISGLVGAVCILQFTYTFPAILAFAFQIQKDAMTPDEVFDPRTSSYSYRDRGLRRWVRGFKVKWHLNTFNFIYFLGALVTAALGIYSSVEGLISAFSAGGAAAATSFGCASPV